MTQLLYRADVLLLGAVLLPFVSAALILIFHRVPRSYRVFTLASSCALLPILYRLYVLCSGGEYVALQHVLTSSLHLTLQPEAFGMVFSLLVSVLWITTNVYTLSYMDKTDQNQKNKERYPVFYACFSASIGCTLCLAFAGNVATLFIAYEVLTACTYPLIAHGLSASALEGGSFCLRTLLCTSMLLFLPAVVIMCGLDGAMGSFDTVHFISETHSSFLPVLTVLLCYGVAKAAMVPVHIWLPKAMVAPTPVSALLHAVAVVKSGVFTIIKITVYVLGIRGMSEYYGGSAPHFNILMFISAATVIIGSLAAIRQTSMKGLLAYSTVSQLSYITLALSMYTDEAVRASVFQMVCHAFAKITLFFSVGAIYASTGKTETREISGIGRMMPVTAGAFCIGAFAMIGVPPAATFWGKFSILSAAVSGEHLVVALTIVASTLLNTSYFVPVMYRMFFSRATYGGHSEAPLPMLAAMIFSSACTVLLFLKPDVVFGILDSMELALAPR
ncbi:MAG: proton-conducting transporter transmembrane domain-containing protein [Anaplasma sp.]